MRVSSLQSPPGLYSAWLSIAAWGLEPHPEQGRKRGARQATVFAPGIPASISGLSNGGFHLDLAPVLGNIWGFGEFRQNPRFTFWFWHSPASAIETSQEYLVCWKWKSAFIMGVLKVFFFFKTGLGFSLKTFPFSWQRKSGCLSKKHLLDHRDLDERESPQTFFYGCFPDSCLEGLYSVHQPLRRGPVAFSVYTIASVRSRPISPPPPTFGQSFRAPQYSG